MAGWLAREKRLGGLAALVLLTSGLIPASAASAWSIVPSPSAPAHTDELAGVSCLSATSCIAVGDQVGPNGVNRTLVERWNGTSWSVQPSASLTAPSILTAVSCSSLHACAAVGYIATATADGQQVVTALAEVWNGRAWSVTPTPDAANAKLTGVSCISATECLAVSNAGGRGILIEIWNGSGWRVQADSLPGIRGGTLFGISCTSAAFCAVVGSGVPDTLAATWNGKTWTVEPTGTRPRNSFVDVSCASPAWCMAVADTGSAAWNGKTWTFEGTPTPANGQLSLAAVSCASPAFCLAVGHFDSNGTLTTLPVAEAWNGRHWAVEAPVNPPPQSYSILSGVACASAGSCQAAGFFLDSSFGDDVLTEGRSPGWRIEPSASPVGAGVTYVTAVSCPAPSACMVVGYQDRGGYSIGFAERWDGSRWTVLPVAEPGQRQVQLLGVSCTSATACIAVGESLTAPNGPPELTSRALAERWNGTSWAIEAAPAPGLNSSLGGVSCWSASGCIAVGYGTAPGPGFFSTLAERWNGSTWTVQRTPNPVAGASDQLSGVSCTAATACTAVGYISTGVPVAQQWNGSAWTASRFPATGAATSRLEGVSCTARAACEAVGWSFDNTSFHPLAASLTGAGWALQPVPDPAPDPQLLGVSCAPAGCVAVGTDHAGALIEGSAGPGKAWSEQAAAQPVAGYRPALSGASCGAGACTVAGDVTPYADGTQVTLIERRT